jgi:hypothetical protein
MHPGTGPGIGLVFYPKLRRLHTGIAGVRDGHKPFSLSLSGGTGGSSSRFPGQLAAAVSGKDCSAHGLLEHTRDELSRAHHAVSPALFGEIKRPVCCQTQLVLPLDRRRLDVGQVRYPDRH